MQNQKIKSSCMHYHAIKWNDVHAEVKFVNTVTAGGSVKFLQAV